ncbi:MAG: ribosome recycling factor [Gammaproteobacteria bacterium]|nr:ribosome recycling factor [Gammaproteobacteria bacterium]MXY58478.1 ribosome recycling factor [Gammaproteobacteria bacterium]MYF29994.1 ribosome recycling factor [Gammaproteobacteria bacterium]MYK48160.1 ribosome recycling factor [Gammaproteobacteria bacterium]
MIEEFQEDATERMDKSLDALATAFSRIRTGRANPAILSGVEVDYYGNPTPINQVANIMVEEARTLVVAPWEKRMVPEIEKAILKSDLGLTPASGGDVIRLPLPPLTEENRRDLIRQARHEAENARIAIRNIRRDAIGDVRELVREKEATEDEGHRSEEDIQRITDAHIGRVDAALAEKESDLIAF